MNRSSQPRPQFQADCVPSNDQLLLRISGRLVIDPRVQPDWRACLAQSKHRDIAVDLAGVTSIDASGLGLIAEIARETRLSGGRLAVVSASPRVRRMLALTRLDAVLDGGVGARAGARGPKVAA